MSMARPNNRVFDAKPATAADQSAEKKRGMFAKVGDGCWYAVPPGRRKRFGRPAPKFCKPMLYRARSNAEQSTSNVQCPKSAVRQFK